MGVGGEKKPLPEIGETQASVRDDKFEEIVERISKVASDFEDEEHPYYITIGDDDFEVGVQRLIHFNVNKFDFELTRTVEYQRISGEGRQKHLEDNPSPKITIKLRRKSQYENDWQVVDMDDLF